MDDYKLLAEAMLRLMGLCAAGLALAAVGCLIWAIFSDHTPGGR